MCALNMFLNKTVKYELLGNMLKWDKNFELQVKWDIPSGEFIYIEHININFLLSKWRLQYFSYLSKNFSLSENYCVIFFFFQ